MSTAQLLINVTANAGSANAVLNELMQQTRLLEAGFANIGAAVQEASAKTEEAHGVFGRLGEQFASVGKIAAGMALGSLAANLTMGLEERFAAAAEQIDTFGNSVLKIQCITGESAASSSALVAMFQRYTPSADAATNAIARFERVLAGTSEAIDVASTGGKTGAKWLEEYASKPWTPPGISETRCRFSTTSLTR